MAGPERQKQLAALVEMTCSREFSRQSHPAGQAFRGRFMELDIHFLDWNHLISEVIWVLSLSTRHFEG